MKNKTLCSATPPLMPSHECSECYYMPWNEQKPCIEVKLGTLLLRDWHIMLPIIILFYNSRKSLFFFCRPFILETNAFFLFK